MPPPRWRKRFRRGRVFRRRKVAWPHKSQPYRGRSAGRHGGHAAVGQNRSSTWREFRPAVSPRRKAAADTEAASDRRQSSDRRRSMTNTDFTAGIASQSAGDKATSARRLNWSRRAKSAPGAAAPRCPRSSTCRQFGVSVPIVATSITTGHIRSRSIPPCASKMRINPATAISAVRPTTISAP